MSEERKRKQRRWVALAVLALGFCACTPQQGRLSHQAQPTRQKVHDGSKVYDASECIGAVVMGRCHGTILPKSAYHPTCYGKWLNGRCIGPMF